MTLKKNPWKIHSTQVSFDNPWLRVDTHDVTNPAGKPGVYGTVHFKNLACAIIPVDEQLDTWLVGQYRFPLEEYSWEVPMGGVKVGTDPLEGAQRELLEETGLTAARWQPILNLHLSNSVTDETGIVYLATELTHGEPDFDDTEVIEIKKLPFADVVEMVHTGEITDALSVAGILKLAAVL